MKTTDTLAAELAACLFDLRAAQEADLRTLTWIQRNLEGVRSGSAAGDVDLLLGEMARLLANSEQTADTAAACRQSAAGLLRGIIEERTAAAVPRGPVAVVAA